MTDYSALAAMALPAAVAAESSGNPNAANPNSSATGLLQFTDPTWAGLAKNYPQDGYTPQNKNDPAFQKKAFMRMATSEYGPALDKAGVTATPQDLYLMHHLGTPNGIKVLTADPSAPASSVIGAAWPGIQGANRNLLPDANATVGDVRSRISGLAGAAPADPAQDGQAPATPQQAEQVNLQADPAAQVPDAPVLPEKEDPNANRTWLDRLIGGLGAWGAGANGQDFAAGLGQGAQNVLAQTRQDREDSEKAADANRAIALENWQNKVKQVDAQDGVAQSRVRRASALADLLKSGLPLSTASAILDGRGGSFSGVDPAVMASRGAKPQQDSYEAPVTMQGPSDADGNTPFYSMTTNKRTGKPQYVNMATGETTDHVDGIMPVAQTDTKAIADQSIKDRSEAQGKLKSMDELADNMGQLVALAPEIALGPSMSDRAVRALSAMTGKDFGDNKAAAATEGARLLNASRLSAIHALPGRLDIPVVKTAFGSTYNLETQPENLFHGYREVQRVRERLGRYEDDWDALPANSSWKTQKGYGAYIAHRARSEPKEDPKDLKARYDADLQDYNNLHRAANTAAPSPAAASPTSHIGPAQTPQVFKTKTGVPWSR